MAIQVNGTSVITDSKVLQNVTGLKTINGTSVLGSGDIVTSGGWTSATTRVATSATVTLTAGTYIVNYFFFNDNNSGSRTISPISAVEYLMGAGSGGQYLGANGALYSYGGSNETSTTSISISNFGSITTLMHLTASTTFTISTRVVSMYYTKLS